MKNKCACILGATGLVGSQLLHLILADDRFDEVKIFVRRDCGIIHPKLKQHIIDFDEASTYTSALNGDVLFSCLGTTLRVAGSKEAQYKVDVSYQLEFAKTAANNGIKNYVLVSSAGANAKSRVFYSRIKGELENAIMQLDFDKISVIQPGILKGKRTEFRLGERIGIAAMAMFGMIPALGAYRPIPDFMVAKAMINAFFKQKEKVKKYALGQVFELGEG